MWVGRENEVARTPPLGELQQGRDVDAIGRFNALLCKEEGQLVPS